MVSKFTLLSSLLLASAALAVPSPLVEASLARGREERQPRPISHVVSRADFPSCIYSCWAGSVVTGGPGSVVRFDFASAKITVPQVNDNAETHAVAAVVLGSYEHNRTIKLGFAFGSDKNGLAFYYPIIEENDEPHVYAPNIPIRAGDTIYAKIRLHPDYISADLVLSNPSTPERPPFRAVHKMGECLNQTNLNAAFVVEGYKKDALPNFGDVTFYDIVTHSLRGLNSTPHILLYNIEKDGRNLARVSEGLQCPNSLTITRLPST